MYKNILIYKYTNEKRCYNKINFNNRIYIQINRNLNKYLIIAPRNKIKKKRKKRNIETVQNNFNSWNDTISN